MRYKTWTIAPDGSRTFLGMYWNTENLVAALKCAGSGKFEIESVNYGKPPAQCSPGYIPEWSKNDFTTKKPRPK